MRQLDKKDRGLLYELDCNSRISFSDLGKKLRMSPEAVRYRYERLRDDGVLESCYAVVDSGKLGFMQYKLFLKFQSVTADEVQSIIEFARNSRMALRGVQIDGPYDLIIVCKVVNLDEFDRFIVSLVGRFNSFIRRRIVSLNIWARYLPRRYLVDEERPRAIDRGYRSAGEAYDLDRTNRFILQQLTANSRMAATELADAIEREGSLVPISSHAVGKRIDTLVADKVITGFSITIDHDNYYQTMFKLLLFMNPLSETERARFVLYCTRIPNAVHFIKTIGEWDYELDLEAENVREAHRVIMDITREFPRAVQDYVTFSNMKAFKYRFVETDT